MGTIYSALRTGFRVLPRPLRTALLKAVNRTMALRRVDARARFGRLKLKVASYVGRYRCPVCVGRLGHFEPIPSVFIEEARKHGFKYLDSGSETCNIEQYSCPRCGASDRDRLYALYMREYFPSVAPDGVAKVVDFAPSAPLSDFIRSLIAGLSYNVSYRTADLFAEGVDDRVDITDMKAYSDGSVDFFICSHILEHVADDKKALGELYRVLKRNGRGILVVPLPLAAEEIDEDPSVTDPAERWRRFGQDDHVRLYSKSGFLARVGQAGFKVHQFGIKHFGKATFRRHGIADRSILYVVEKP